jgi:hypothetical protein
LTEVTNKLILTGIGGDELEFTTPKVTHEIIVPTIVVIFVIPAVRGLGAPPTPTEISLRKSFIYDC